MTKSNKAIAAHGYADHYSVSLRPGEGLWDARRRWEKETGRRGMVLIR